MLDFSNGILNLISFYPPLTYTSSTPNTCQLYNEGKMVDKKTIILLSIIYFFYLNNIPLAVTLTLRPDFMATEPFLAAAPVFQHKF